MMSGRHVSPPHEEVFPPSAVLSSQAVDCIRAVIYGQADEAGGLLAGARTLDGSSYLITSATEPGPNALRERCRFRSDESFQRRQLADMQEHLGVSLLGEWHSHPNSLHRPSAWDERELGELLRARPESERTYLVGIANWTALTGFALYLYEACLSGGLLRLSSVRWSEAPLWLESERAFTDPLTASRPSGRSVEA